MRSRGADLSAITSLKKVPKPALFRWLSFAAFDEDDDDNNFIGIDDDDEDDDEEDDSDDDYDDVYDEIDDEEDDDNDDDNDDDDDDDGDEDVDGGDDSDCSDDGDNDFKPKPRGWMYRVTTPQDLMLHLFSLQRWGSSPERNGENSSAAGGELLDLMLTFNDNSDASSDGGNASGPEDFFS
ncbi:hypothetical protein SCA6_006093 [Theobroma cacao]